MSTPTLVVLAGVALGCYAVYLQRRLYFFQYLFLCRLPITVALVLAVALPVSMVVLFENMLGNLADLGFFGIMFTSWFAVHVAWVILFSMWMLLEVIPRNARLGFVREGLQMPVVPRGARGMRRLAARLRSWPLRLPLAAHRITRGEFDMLGNPALLCYSLLALPLIATLVWRSSRAGSNPLWVNVSAALLGYALAWLVRIVAIRLTRGAPTMIEIPLEKLVAKLDRKVRQRAAAAPAARKRDQPRVGLTYEPAPQENLDRRRGRALAFIVLTFGFYVAGAYLLSPNRPEWMPGNVPVLLTVLLLLTLACLVLSWIASVVDVMRVPVFLTLLTVMFVSFQLLGKDHYYALIPVADERTAAGLTPEQLIGRWTLDHSDDAAPVMVVVAASGGGIKAGRWAADVLTRLQHEVGAAFGDSIAVISSVSGGAMGAMYFIDRYRDGKSPVAEDLCGIKDAAGASSLNATSWGFLYRDMWSALPGLPGKKDRGWALERAWSRHMLDPDATLRGWGADAREGRRPVPVFQATVVENGERFLLTPFVFGDRQAGSPGHWFGENFNDLYTGWDLPVASAARLSATFAWISPIARPAAGTVDPSVAYHLADGGYFDNHGVASAVDFLRVVKHELAASLADGDQTTPMSTAPKVLLIQIRAATPTELPVSEGGGFTYAIAGPGLTILQVRTATQVARNEVELELLRESWPQQIEFHTVVFDIGSAGPLSWHMTSTDIAEIEAVWTRADLQDGLRRVKALFGDSTPLKGPIDCSS